MIAIIGSTGFVGSHLLPALSDIDVAVRCCLRKAPTDEREVQINLQNTSSLIAAFKGCDTVINLATITRESTNERFDDVIFVGMRNIINAARVCGVKHIIHIGALVSGSCKRYASGFAYLYWKERAKELLEQSGIRYTIFETSFVVGKGDQFLSLFGVAAKTLPWILVPASALQTRVQPILVQDLVRYICKSIHNPVSYNNIYAAVGTEVFTVRELLDLASKAVSHTPGRILPTGDFLFRQLLNSFNHTLAYRPVTSTIVKMCEISSTGDARELIKDFHCAPEKVSERLAYLSDVSLENLAFKPFFRSLLIRKLQVSMKKQPI